MRLLIFQDYDQISKKTAEFVINLINERENERPVVLGLSAGYSVLRTFSYLVEAYKNNQVSFENVITFNIDEFVDLPRDSPHSQHTYMWENFFSKINIRRENINFLDGNTLDWDDECARYEEKIREVGGIDLIFFGTGLDGHVGRNEPGSSFESRTRPKTLAYDTLLQLSKRHGVEIDKVPKIALTMGLKTIMDARQLLVLFSGVERSHALERCLEQGINHMFPVSIAQLHPKVCFICDEDSTLELRVKTVRYFQGLAETVQNYEASLKASKRKRIEEMNNVNHDDDNDDESSKKFKSV